MKFKIDESLPAECATALQDAGFDAVTVSDENLTGADDSLIVNIARTEKRVLVTLDLDFASIKAYPSATHTGIIVLRLKRQDKRTLVAVMPRIISALAQRTPFGQLWIVEPDRIRFRTE